VPYVITNLCTNDGACVDVCPVACIHTKPGAPQFYIDPEVCIDCEQCEIVCPVDAIFKDIDMPAEHLPSIEVNAAFFRQNKAAVGPVPFDTAWEMIHSAQEYASWASP
jgi:ferredoxin--NADP+ reductase